MSLRCCDTTANGALILRTVLPTILMGLTITTVRLISSLIKAFHSGLAREGGKWRFVLILFRDLRISLCFCVAGSRCLSCGMVWCGNWTAQMNGKSWMWETINIFGQNSLDYQSCMLIMLPSTNHIRNFRSGKTCALSCYLHCFC